MSGDGWQGCSQPVVGSSEEEREFCPMLMQGLGYEKDEGLTPACALPMWI